MRGHPLVSGIFCALFLGLALSSMWHKTPTYDELGHLQFGYKVLRGVVTEPDMQRMPVTAFNALASEAAEAVAGPLADEARLRSSRLGT